MSKKIGTQIDLVLDYLWRDEEDKGLSPLEAFGLWGVTRLASIVEDLRSRGHVIDTEMHRDVTGKKYARYYYIGQAHGAYTAKQLSAMDMALKQA